jgi:hypothetical protein
MFLYSFVLLLAIARRKTHCRREQVLEDITGHYEPYVRRRRIYDVVNVLKAVLPHFYDKKMNK